MTGQQLDLDAIEARTNAATQGPWGSHRDLSAVYTIQARPRLIPGYGNENDGDIATLAADRTDAESYANARFIAHAREDVAALLAEVRRLRAAEAPLTDSERTMLTYALDEAQEHIWSRAGFTDEDQAAVDSLRARAAAASVSGGEQQ